MTVHFSKNSVDAGSIHVENGARLPAFFEFGGASLLKGWSELRNARSTLEAATTQAGWISFFMAGSIEKSSFGVDRQKTLVAALRRLARQVKSDNCNSFEITQVTGKQFLGIFRITVTAHARQVREAKEGLVCFGQ